MNKRQTLIITLLVALLLAILTIACFSSPGYWNNREALDICKKCGWTGIERTRSSPWRTVVTWETYCTRTRDGNSEIMLIEEVIEGCLATETMPND